MEQTKRCVCPKCKGSNINQISRIVGYFSKTKNWSPSKLEEKKSREAGDYGIATKAS